MTDLLLQPSGTNEYAVIDGDWIVGHIVLLSPAMARTPWMWSLDHAFHKGRDPTHGFAATREAATQAFARSWFGENPPESLVGAETGTRQFSLWVVHP